MQAKAAEMNEKKEMDEGDVGGGGLDTKRKKRRKLLKPEGKKKTFGGW
jgi:hypothetical protein